MIGIRAYQWGWEYFYPKSIDLNYNVNPSYSAVVGNSLKYFNTSSNSLKSNTLWKFHQSNRDQNLSSVPAHVILTPSDNSNLINFMNLDDIGVSTVKDSTAFKKIQFFSKIDPSALFNTRSDFQHTFNKLGGYYNNDTDLNYSYSYGMDRQHNYTSLSSTLPLFSTLLDSRSVDKFLSYNFSNISGHGSNKQPSNNLSINRLSYGDSSDQHNSTLTNYTNLLPENLKKSSDLDFQLFLKSPSILSVLNAETDSKQLSNTFKFSLNFRHKKKLLWDLQNVMSNLGTEDLTSPNATTKFISQVYNTENLFKFKDLKSSNAQFLGSERTVRLLNNLNSNSYK